MADDDKGDLIAQTGPPSVGDGRDIPAGAIRRRTRRLVIGKRIVRVFVVLAVIRALEAMLRKEYAHALETTAIRE